MRPKDALYIMGHERIRASAALAELLGARGEPVVTRYALATAAWRIYAEPDQLPSRVRRRQLDRPAFLRLESELIRQGMLRPVPGVAQHAAYTLLGAPAAAPGTLACALDPFCYLSHLSAMEFHGLSDRMPELLYLSSPAPAPWRSFATAQMQRDLGQAYADFVQASLPGLQRIRFTRVAGHPIHLFRSLHLGAFRHFKQQHLRVATLGRTFLNMLQEPGLCGGLDHVLSVFREHAATHARLIFDELDQHGRAIDKVRAGWILEEVCGIHDARIDAWSAFAQRGGSQRLDATAEYGPRFSERWKLSLNVPLALP